MYFHDFYYYGLCCCVQKTLSLPHFISHEMMLPLINQDAYGAMLT